MSLVRTAEELKVGLDFQTPMEVAKYMCGMVPSWCKTGCEPTKGIGVIEREMQAIGLEVTAPDDYFLMDKSQRFDCIVMNPPFSAKYAYLENAQGDFTKHGMRLGYHILQECMQMSDNVIALMPWFTISDSDVRLRYIKNYGLKSITSLPRKTFQYARIQTMILELERGYKGNTDFIVYDLISQASNQQQKLFI